MALKRSKLQQIPQRNKDLAFGFVKESEKTNKSSVPEMIKYLCLIYLNQNKDKFDHNSSHKDILIEGSSIKKNGITGESSCLLTNIVTTGIHIWTFKVNEFCKADMIGIRKNDLNSEKQNLDRWVCDDNERIRLGGYGCFGWGEIRGKKHYFKSYGESWNVGDIIEMRVDLNDLSLSYRVNNNDNGKAFDIEPGKYRAGVTLYGSCSSYCLISYQHIY